MGCFFLSPPPTKKKKPTLKSSHQFSNSNPGFENFKLKESLHLPYHLTSGVLYSTPPPLPRIFRNKYCMAFIFYLIDSLHFLDGSMVCSLVFFFLAKKKKRKLHVCETLIAVLLALTWKGEAGYLSLSKYT